ncbi:hypothetical protein KY366_06705 [Candidatus Woesearchaeota archaeon]|nr:hypothetical protein [Candidatus Woesearchaeota archaeon]
MQDKTNSYLTEWTINFLKNRDLMLKNIELIEKDKDGFDVYVKFKDKEQFFISRPIIGDIDDILPKFDEQGHFGLVVFNTLSNFNSLVKNWGKLIKFKHLWIYFVNPLSKLDKRWVVCPCTHNNICDTSALEKGLRSMFETVEAITEEKIKGCVENAG